MADKRLHRETLPYEKYEIDAIENWLDEHARQGLRLKRIEGLRFLFEQPEEGASMTRYRIDVKRSWGYDLERQRTFQELGWEFVDGIDNHLDVYRAVRPDAVELNTDEEALQGVLGRYYRNEYVNILFSLLAAVLMAALIWRYSNRSGGFCTALLADLGRSLLPAVLVILYALFCGVIHLMMLIRAKRRIQTERDYHSAALARRRAVFRRFVWITFIAILLLNLSRPGPVSAAVLPDSAYPVPALSQICPDESYQTVLMERNYLLSRECSVSAPEERFLFTEDGTEDLTVPRYVVRLFDARWSSLAEKAAREQTAGRETRIVSVPGWTGGWYYETAGSGRIWQHLVLLEGNRLLLADYSGAGDLLESLALFAQ